MAKGARFEVTGLKDIQKNLRKEISNIRGDVKKGLILALVFLRGKVLKVTPIDFGILRNSIFTQVEGSGKDVEARIGFTADYAAAVHENTGANFRAPNTGAKFLENPIMENADRILKIVQDEAKIS